jgi:hypothetical protein
MDYKEIIAASELYWETDGREGAIANLSGADLSGADLSDADLRVADLSDANLSDANLRDANLSDANLSDANLSDANLSGADLSDANLSDANLSGANLSSANLSDANLSGAIRLAPVTENAIAILLQVADRVVGQPDALKMKGIHTCDTTHCGAGWVCYLSPIAATLEKILGWNVAACIVCPIPEFTGLFYATDSEMMAFLTSVKGDRGASLRTKYLCPQ